MLKRFHLYLRTNYGDTSSIDISKDWKAFEYISALECEKKYNTPTSLWEYVNPDIKDNMGLPIPDVGIDYITDNYVIFGQSKYYSGGIFR